MKRATSLAARTLKRGRAQRNQHSQDAVWLPLTRRCMACSLPARFARRLCPLWMLWLPGTPYSRFILARSPQLPVRLATERHQLARTRAKAGDAARVVAAVVKAAAAFFSTLRDTRDTASHERQLQSL